MTEQTTPAPFVQRPDGVANWSCPLAFYEATKIRKDGRDLWVPGWTPVKRDVTWDGMVAGFTRFRPAIDKMYAPAWSPGVPVGDRRCNDDVTHLSCLVLDVDDGPDFRMLADRFVGVPLILHTSWSHTPERPKGRIIVPLAEPVPVGWWPRVWHWANALAGGCMDPATKDPARLYFLPATDGRPHEAWVQSAGSLLDLRPYDTLPPTPEEVAAEEARRLRERQPRQPWRPGAPDAASRARRYAEQVLARRCEAVASSTKYRNKALCAAAWTVGGYVGGGYLDEGTAIADLALAGEAAGLGHEEAADVASRMVRGGKAKPLHPSFVESK